MDGPDAKEQAVTWVFFNRPTSAIAGGDCFCIRSSSSAKSLTTGKS